MFCELISPIHISILGLANNISSIVLLGHLLLAPEYL